MTVMRILLPCHNIRTVVVDKRVGRKAGGVSLVAGRVPATRAPIARYSLCVGAEGGGLRGNYL